MRIEIDTDDWVDEFRYQRGRLIRRLFPRQMEVVDAVVRIAFYATATRSQLSTLDLINFMVWSGSVKFQRADHMALGLFERECDEPAVEP